MRPAVKMLLVACGFAALVARCGPAAANEPPNRFRILFKDGVAAPADDGRVGEQNRQAIRRMAQMLSVWPAASPLTFIFVAPKASVCGSDPSCNPDQMLWQRTMATQSAASQAAKTLGLSFKFTLMRQDFIEAVTPSVLLAPAPAGYAAMDLRLYADAAVSRPPASGNCAWTVAVEDPDLPPAISRRGAVASITVADGQAIATGRAANLQARPLNPSAPEAAGVWEGPAGPLCRAQLNDAGDVSIVPAGAQRLLLLAARTTDSNLRAMLNAAPATCPGDPRRSVVASAMTSARSGRAAFCRRHPQSCAPSASSNCRRRSDYPE